MAVGAGLPRRSRTTPCSGCFGQIVPAARVTCAAGSHTLRCVLSRRVVSSCHERNAGSPRQGSMWELSRCCLGCMPLAPHMEVSMPQALIQTLQPAILSQGRHHHQPRPSPWWLYCLCLGMCLSMLLGSLWQPVWAEDDARTLARRAEERPRAGPRPWVIPSFCGADGTAQPQSVKPRQADFPHTEQSDSVYGTLLGRPRGQGFQHVWRRCHPQSLCGRTTILPPSTGYENDGHGSTFWQLVQQ